MQLLWSKEGAQLRIYYGKDNHYVYVATMTPKMLRQMRYWDKAGLANISIVGYPEGSKSYLLIHIKNVHVEYSILQHH